MEYIPPDGDPWYDPWNDPSQGTYPNPSGTPSGPPTPAPPGVPEDTGTGPNLGSYGAPPPFSGSSRPTFHFAPVPRFTAPRFQRPSLRDAMNEPGYGFRLQGGSDALQRSAAARGTLRTGGTLRDIMEYGQNFASQEYSNVFNRALAEYDRTYQGARDEFAPSLAEWSMLSSAEREAALAQFQREWDVYSFGNSQNSQYERMIADFYNQQPPTPPTQP